MQGKKGRNTKKRIFRKSEKNIEKQKQEFYNNLLKNWIEENKQEYKEIFEKQKELFLENSSSNIKNPDILIKAKVNSFIKKEILGV